VGTLIRHLVMMSMSVIFMTMGLTDCTGGTKPSDPCSPVACHVSPLPTEAR
jgi:hypothetical protein